jgi:hypothetical protein
MHQPHAFKSSVFPLTRAYVMSRCASSFTTLHAPPAARNPSTAVAKKIHLHDLPTDIHLDILFLLLLKDECEYWDLMDHPAGHATFKYRVDRIMAPYLEAVPSIVSIWEQNKESIIRRAAVVQRCKVAGWYSKYKSRYTRSRLRYLIWKAVGEHQSYLSNTTVKRCCEAFDEAADYDLMIGDLRRDLKELAHIGNVKCTIAVCFNAPKPILE